MRFLDFDYILEIIENIYILYFLSVPMLPFHSFLDKTTKITLTWETH